MNIPRALKVIIVEDESLLQIQYAEAIEGAFPGARIFALRDSQNLLSTYELSQADVIITDLVMDSQHEGISGLSGLQQAQYEVPVIVVSGHPDFAEMAEFFKVNHVFIKPVDMGALMLCVSQLTGFTVQSP